MNFLKYKRVLLKLSGEYLKGSSDLGIDGDLVFSLAREIQEIQELGCELGIVLGGGNFWRYRDFQNLGLDRVSSDSIGMLANLMNSLALESALKKIGVQVRTMSSLPCPKLMEDYVIKRAHHHLSSGKVVIFAGGTGNPFFTTDSAAALRALEISCDLFLKATRVDYVYDKDPEKFSDAKELREITYREVIERNLGVMDMTCATLAREGDLKMLVFNIGVRGNLLKAVSGERIGTLISNQ